MKEVKGNIWGYHKQGYWIVITTNGIIRNDGACVMGRGTALQAKQVFPKLPYELGKLIRTEGNKTFSFPHYKIITLPVKHHWRNNADIRLIEESIQDLVDNFSFELKGCTVYLTRPGCGNGRLNWIDVEPILDKYLDDRYIICDTKTEVIYQ